MLVASLLLGLTMAAIGEVMVITTLASNKMQNRAIGINSSRTVVNRVLKDVREASNFGDSYDAVVNDPDDIDVHDRNEFPCSDNPLYDAATGPTFISANFTWNGWPSNWPTPPYQLDGQTLIIQKPKLFDAQSVQDEKFNGLPLKLEANALGTDVPRTNLANLDTVVYRLIQDPDESTEFILQRAVFVGYDGVNVNGTIGTNYTSMVNPPQTIAKGIIGPLPAGGGTVPEIFTYYEKDYTSTSLHQEVTPLELSSNPDGVRFIVGVGVDLELKNSTSSYGIKNEQNQQRLGIHSEAFLRSGRDISAKN